MQIDPKAVKWDDEPIDPAKVKWDDKPAGPSTPKPPTGYTLENLKRFAIQSPPGALLRAAKDIVDTGADQLSRLGGADERARVQAMNEAGRREFDAAAEGQMGLPQFGRLAGQVAVTAPVVAALGGRVAAAGLPRLGNAISSSGFRTGATPVGAMAKAGDMGIRTLGGGIAGGVSAGMVNPEDADTGAIIGAALPGATKTAGVVGQKIAAGAKGAVKHGLGLSTGVGAEPIVQAYKAGRTGNADFVRNMRGEADLTDVLDRAKQALQTMRADRSAQYRSGMAPIKGDQSVLSFADIDAALVKAQDVATFKGQVKSKSAADALSQMRAAVDEWRGLDPAQFHTPEGLDALKQRLGDIVESLPFESKQARLAAGQVYAATKKTIEAQAPSYAKVMRDYSTAADQIREIERALSLGDKASKDTAMRKLQSLMRNNVQTNYGNRLNLANTLEQQGGQELLPSIAGQAVNSWTPRSLVGQALGGATAYTSFTNPLMLGALPMQSPRLMGEAMYAAGSLGRLAANKGNALMQTPALGGAPANALALDPSDLARLGYRVAPLAGSSR